MSGITAGIAKFWLLFAHHHGVGWAIGAAKHVLEAIPG